MTKDEVFEAFGVPRDVAAEEHNPPEYLRRGTIVFDHVVAEGFPWQDKPVSFIIGVRAE